MMIVKAYTFASYPIDISRDILSLTYARTKRPAVDSLSVNLNLTKIPKPSAKQGDVFASFGAQEFGQDDPPHH